MKNYDEVSVLKALNQKNIKASGKTLVIPESGLGNGTWGKINYLTKYCGYSYRTSAELEAVNLKLKKHKPAKSLTKDDIKHGMKKLKL